jgi:hypothetical protein
MSDKRVSGDSLHCALNHSRAEAWDALVARELLERRSKDAVHEAAVALADDVIAGMDEVGVERLVIRGVLHGRPLTFEMSCHRFDAYRYAKAALEPTPIPDPAAWIKERIRYWNDLPPETVGEAAIKLDDGHIDYLAKLIFDAYKERHP